MFMARASFKIAVKSDTHIILVDLDDGRSLANDILSVVARLKQVLPGGFGRRRIYFRATDQSFHEVLLSQHEFAGFQRCSPSQQLKLEELLR